MSLFADTYPIMWMVIALVLIFGAGAVMMFAGRWNAQAKATGGATTGSYYLTLTLFLILIIGGLFGGMFVLTSFR